LSVARPCSAHRKPTGSVDHGLELSRAFPEDQPSGMAVVFSVQVAAKAYEREAEVVDRPVRLRDSMAACAQDCDIFLGEHARRETGFDIITTTEFSQILENHPQDLPVQVFTQ